MKTIEAILYTMFMLMMLGLLGGFVFWVWSAALKHCA